MASSALESVTAYVQKLLEDSAAENLKDITVLWGPPVGDDRPSELVMVGFGPDGQSGESEREWKLIGNQTLEEKITLELAVEVTQAFSGTNLKPAYTRSTQIAAAVETAIRADTTLGDRLILPARLSRWRGRYFRNGEARGHRVFQALTGTARI